MVNEDQLTALCREFYQAVRDEFDDTLPVEMGSRHRIVLAIDGETWNDIAGELMARFRFLLRREFERIEEEVEDRVNDRWLHEPICEG